MPNTIIAIATSDRVAAYRDQVTHIIDHERFSQGFGALPEFQANNNLHLVIDGGHGTADSTGAPQTLNDQAIADIKKQIQAMKAKLLQFKSITLTSCFSASFIPLFKELLVDDGVIFCQTLSSTASADRLLEEAPYQSNDLFSLHFAMLESKFCFTREICEAALAHNQCFMSDAIYTKNNNTLHRFKFKNLDKALYAHNQIINAGNLEDCKEELETSARYLQAQGIRVSDASIDPDHMELTAREICFRFSIRTMQRSDFSEINPLDARIFPDEPALNLNSYYDKDYSWVMIDTNTEPASIAGYLFARPQPDGSLFIGNVGVKPECQGIGIASKLLNEIVAKADQEKKSICLQVRANNQAAIKLYEKHGFIQTTSNNGWLSMSRLSKGVAAQQNPLPSPSNGPSHPTKINTPVKANEVNYSFLLKLAVFSFSVCLLLLAAVFFPPLGLAATLGIKAIASIGTTTSYAISGISAVSGLCGMGFFGYMVHHDSTKPTSSDQPNPLPV